MKNIKGTFPNQIFLKILKVEKNIDKNVQDISDAITKAAEKKIIAVRPNDPQWITCYTEMEISI